MKSLNGFVKQLDTKMTVMKMRSNLAKITVEKVTENKIAGLKLSKTFLKCIYLSSNFVNLLLVRFFLNIVLCLDRPHMY